MFFKSLEGKANMVSDASSSFLDYLVYNQGCIKFDIYFSSLAEITFDVPLGNFEYAGRFQSPLQTIPKTLSNSLNDERK